jgi:hypothetical protein
MVQGKHTNAQESCAARILDCVALRHVLQREMGGVSEENDPCLDPPHDRVAVEHQPPAVAPFRRQAFLDRRALAFEGGI